MGIGLGDRLEEAREAAGYSRDQVASELGWHYNKLWRYETGRQEPGASVLGALATLYGVSADELLGIRPVGLCEAPEGVMMTRIRTAVESMPEEWAWGVVAFAEWCASRER